MILLADSGSTKTQWALYDGNNWLFKETEGLNPYFVTKEQITNSLKKNFSAYQVTKVYFYGSGCNSKDKKDTIAQSFRDSIPSVTQIEVESDLLGAARAVYGRKSGWIGILGTGSNVAFYDGNEIIKYRPSLGYILGDEGSGAHLGKVFIKKLLYNELSLRIESDFFNKYNTSISELLSKIYSQANPNRFLAGFSEFIYDNKNDSNIKSLILNCFDKLFKVQVVPFNQQNEPISFVGSIAFYFAEELKESAINNKISIATVLKSPLEGLVKFHVMA